MRDRLHNNAMAEMYQADPALSSFSAILKAMGMRLSVQPNRHKP
jgi:DNA-binding phage protein